MLTHSYNSWCIHASTLTRLHIHGPRHLRTTHKHSQMLTNTQTHLHIYTPIHSHTTHHSNKHYNVNSHSQMLTNELSLSHCSSLSPSYAHVSALENGQLRKIGIAFFGAIKLRDISNFFRKKTGRFGNWDVVRPTPKNYFRAWMDRLRNRRDFFTKSLNYVLKVWGINYQQRPVASGLGTKKKKRHLKRFVVRLCDVRKNDW